MTSAAGEGKQSVIAAVSSYKYVHQPNTYTIKLITVSQANWEVANTHTHARIEGKAFCMPPSREIHGRWQPKNQKHSPTKNVLQQNKCGQRELLNYIQINGICSITPKDINKHVLKQIKKRTQNLFWRILLLLVVVLFLLLSSTSNCDGVRRNGMW